MSEPFIIFLNGISSSGKSTIARALQEIYPTPLLHTGIDNFISMIPKRFIGTDKDAKLGFYFECETDSEGQLVNVVTGEYGKRLCNAIPPSVRALVDNGNKVIVDEVIIANQVLLHKYVSFLKGYPVYFIYVTAPIEVIEERERKRGDRIIGLARAQNKLILSDTHKYDLTIDTSDGVPRKSAETIINYIEQNPDPIAFNDLFKTLNS